MKQVVALVSFVCFLGFAVSESLEIERNNDADCLSGPSVWYFGKISQTRTGIQCKKWNANIQNNSSVVPVIPLDGADHNYCRNPDNNPLGVWCFTLDPAIKWDYCDVPKCDDDSKIIWADIRNQSAAILSMKADSDTIKEHLLLNNQMKVSVLTDSHHQDSEITDVTGSYMEQTIFYPDTKLNCVVMTNMEMNMTSPHLCGLAKGIRSMTYDWMRQNLYWTDDVMKWVVVTETRLTYYKPIYIANEGAPRALTIHAKQQKLFFSVNQRMNTKVFLTDLSGGNARAILKYPQVFDVTSLAVDCTDNRLYIADYWGHGSIVISSDLNGANRKYHYFKRKSKFAGISAYMDFIFMTDSTARYNYDGSYVHSMWVKSKSSWRSFRVNFDGKPHGMKIISKKEEKFTEEDFSMDGCLSMPSCDHICLPRWGMSRKCECSVGYAKVGDTGCRAIPANDSFLIVIDGAQDKAFQLKLSSDQVEDVTLLENLVKVSTLAVDPLEGAVLISRGDHLVTKQTLTGKGMIGWTLPMGTSVNTMAVDPTTGNLFFHDVTSRTIYVCDRNYTFLRELVTSSSNQFSDIQQIALDWQHQKVYWTDTNSMVGEGALMRMDMNGSNVEVLLQKLHWPRALTIDYGRSSVFVSEEKKMIVYEVPLNSNQNQTKITHNLKSGNSYFSKSSSIQDITVRQNYLYFLSNHRVMKMDLTSNRITSYSLPMFYSPNFLTAYDSSELHEQ